MQLSRSVRAAGQRVLGHLPVRILSGPNRGMLWSAAALGRGYGSGQFARDRLAALACVVRPGDTFWDVGAHKGFVTLAAARLVGPTGMVVAVEPAAVNRTFLHRHIRWNGLHDRVCIVASALSDAAGEAAFGGGGSSVAFRIGEGSERVRVTTIRDLVCEQDLRAPSVLKIDVEGEEAAVLRGAADILGGDQAVLVSAHSRDLYEECRKLLQERDFRIFDSWQASEQRRAGSQWTSDHDLLAIGPQRIVDERILRGLRLVAGPIRR
jgi:FkbM family methyltransferase